jgi:hypothetical protein
MLVLEFRTSDRWFAGLNPSCNYNSQVTPTRRWLLPVTEFQVLRFLLIGGSQVQMMTFPLELFSAKAKRAFCAHTDMSL